MKQLSATSYILVITLSAISMACIVLLYQNYACRMEIDDLELKNDSLTWINHNLSTLTDSLQHQANKRSLDY
jgi:hypothetical protein